MVENLRQKTQRSNSGMSEDLLINESELVFLRLIVTFYVNYFWIQKYKFNEFNHLLSFL